MSISTDAPSTEELLASVAIQLESMFTVLSNSYDTEHFQPQTKLLCELERGFRTCLTGLSAKYKIANPYKSSATIDKRCPEVAGKK